MSGSGNPSAALRAGTPEPSGTDWRACAMDAIRRARAAEVALADERFRAERAEVEAERLRATLALFGLRP